MEFVAIYLLCTLIHFKNHLQHEVPSVPYEEVKPHIILHIVPQKCKIYK